MSSEHSRSVVEHGQREQAKRDRYDREAGIETLIDRCSRALGRAGKPTEPGGDEYYQFVERACREGIDEHDGLRRLLEAHTGRDLRYFSRDLAGEDAFDYVALDRFLEGEPPRFDGAGYTDRRLVIDAFRSLVAIAQAADVVDEALTNKADAVGFALKIGEHLQDWQFDLGDPVEVTTEQAGTLKTLFFGGTGQGKSTGLEREAEDFYQQNFQEGQDFKLIDLVGIGDGENWYYDLPQQQGSLRRIREEMGLAPDFAASDDLEQPELEILVPLTPGLDDRKLPYHVEGEEFVVKPYVVPAAELSESLLVSVLMARISDKEQNTIRHAYNDVADNRGDWALADIADSIRRRDELQPKTKENAIGVLRNLQRTGFIGTNDSPHTVDWRALFEDTETITVFSQVFLEDELSQFIAIAHLLDTILTQRKQMHNVPEAVLLMRELWEVTPHKGRVKDDPAVASIQQTIGARMTRVLRKNRHYGVHFIGDTQWPGDLYIAAREAFNRYVAYDGTRSTVSDVFDWTSSDRTEAFYNTITPERGTAGIVGQVQPAIDEKGIEFVSPVRYAPPSHHHKDKDGDDNGWRARAKYCSPIRECENDLCGSEDLYRPEGRPWVLCTDCYHLMEDLSLGRTEELRRPRDVEGVAWTEGEPEQEEIDPSVEDDEEEDGDLDVRMSPVAAFVERCLHLASGDWVYKSDVQAAFNAFLTEHEKDTWDFSEHGRAVTFGQRATEAADWPMQTSDREDGKVYINTELTEQGQDYLDLADRSDGEAG